MRKKLITTDEYNQLMAEVRAEFDQWEKDTQRKSLRKILDNAFPTNSNNT